MATPAKLQDMPPEGGYKKIPFERVPAKTYFRGTTMIAGYVGMTTAAIYLYYLNCKQVQRETIEMRSARHAIMPILFAERDREYLKQLRRNRDEENSLMKNVEGWETGTFFSEPIFKTLPEDTFVDPIFKEYYAHAHYRDYAKRAHCKLYT